MLYKARPDRPWKHMHLDFDYVSCGTQSKVEKLKNIVVLVITFPANEFMCLGAIAACSGTEQNVTPF